MLDYIINTIIPYFVGAINITALILLFILWFPQNSATNNNLDNERSIKRKLRKQGTLYALILPFVAVFLFKIHFLSLPFPDFKITKYMSFYFDANEKGLEIEIFKIIDIIFVYVTFVLTYYSPAFIFLYFNSVTSEKTREQLYGKISRGIQNFGKDYKGFKKAIIKDAIEGTKELEQDVGQKLPAFYTPRIFFSKQTLPFFKDLETKGIIFFGGAGSGKTTAIMDYVSELIKWGQKNYHSAWMIYDMKHDFYPILCRLEKDVLFFPTHKDTAIWNCFREFNDITYENGNKIWTLNLRELENFVSYWIKPASKNTDPTWIEKGKKAAIAVMITISRYYPNPSVKDFCDFTMQYNTKDKIVEKIIELGYAQEEGYNISAIFGETEAGANVYEIFEQAVTDLRKKELYYSDEKANFSVKEFNKPLKDLTAEQIKKLSPAERNLDRRIFLVPEADAEEYFKTVFRIIIELQSKKILSFKKDLDRRFYLLIDEAASLGEMPCLLNELPQKGRSFGSAPIIGIQTIASWFDIFGETMTDSILANIKTKVISSIEDRTTQKYFADIFGTVEYIRNNVSSNEKEGGTVSSSIESRDVIKSNELAATIVNNGLIKIGNNLAQVGFRVQNFKTLVSFEEKKDIPKFKTKFGQEEEYNLNQRREEVINAIIELKTKTNKQINPKNVNFIVQKSLDSVGSTLNVIKEEQEQILKSINEMLKLEGYSYDELSLKELSERTGLSSNVISVIYSLIKLDEQMMIKRMLKYIAKLDNSLLEFKNDNEKLKKLIALSGEKEFMVRESYQKIKTNKYLPDELPLEAIIKKEKKEVLADNSESFVPDMINGPDEDIHVKINKAFDENQIKVRKEEEQTRKERLNKIKKDINNSKDRTKKSLDDNKKRIDTMLKTSLLTPQEEVKETDTEIDLSYINDSSSMFIDDIELPEDQIVQDNPYNPHID